MSADARTTQEILDRYRHYGPVFEAGEQAPVTNTYICDLGTMHAPVRVQLAKGETFPEAGGLGAATRWYQTNIQA
ncbi:hypothetical protein [Rubrobacter aplysinae]|uniref:hypothetical protein n=1 Tax=Rubrobacter aplysinae TaxID=909625 RepID=UPI00064BE522|nr:hypothetical protein [Rubrobacter aplysinae]